MFSKLKKDLPSSKVFLMMGNDDCSINLDILKKEEPNLYQIIHNKRLRLNKNFDIVGYSFVPMTPFIIKDWEKFDLDEVPQDLMGDYINRKKTNYRYNGFKSSKDGWEYFKFSKLKEKQDSIQRDLSNKIYLKNIGKTIYVFHAPPNNTALDMIYNNHHVGSMAIRLFIEKYQPYLTLHGHIHETVDVSKNFKHKIGNTLCLSSGNHNVGKNLAALVFDLGNLEGAKRVSV